jgi:hypothetical protein
MNSLSQTPEKILTSESIKIFQDALETLYIKNNLSGRLKFAESWPDAARYIFGEELSRSDCEGLKDKDKRAALEAAAEERRFQLLETVITLEEKSAIKGVLQAEYVEATMQNIGRATALLLYSTWLVDKFLPAAPGEAEAPHVPKDSGDPAAYIVPESDLSPDLVAVKPMPEEPPMPEPEEDPRDAIKPISMEPPKPQAPKKKSKLKIFGIKESPGSGDAG